MSGGGLLLGGVGSLMGRTKPQEHSPPSDAPICQCIRPLVETKLDRDNDQDINTKLGASSISPNAQNLSQLSEFSTNDGRDETKQDSNDRTGPNFETKLCSMFCVF